MSRFLHRWPGLFAALLVSVIALSGAALSVFPALDRVTVPQAPAGMTVAELAASIQAIHPGLTEIRRSPSGRITAWWVDGDVQGYGHVDPQTGQATASADPDPVERWLTNFHRSLFLDDTGRVITAIGAAMMLVLAVTGAMLVARRVGGFRRWFTPLKGPFSGRLHVELARVAVFALVLSATTALWMTADNFELVTIDLADAGFAEAAEGAQLPLVQMQALVDLPLSDLRNLQMPDPTFAGDTLRLETATGAGHVDPTTGALIGWDEAGFGQQVSETIYMLHTGQGAAVLGLVLGLMALAVPVMAATGALVWLAGQRSRVRISANQPVGKAETILLVGSEGGSTWGFAATLHAALTATGQSVHTAPMSAFAPERYRVAKRIIVLAATYGDGDAPSSANGFLDRLAAMDRVPDAPLAVLGFGDRGYPTYCAYADAVVAAAQSKGWRELLPLDTVDRQSPQDFARWGRALGQALGIDLELVHQPVLPATELLTLISRREYGVEVQAPTVILRFALPEVTAWQRLTGAGFARFAAGDLIGVVPDGSPVTRLYSLASARRDGFVEIVVKKQPGGLCSGQLYALDVGQAVPAFVRHNPGFQPGRGRAPLILIGAGTGIGPLAGFVRGNGRQRPIHLFFGMRHPGSDFLYGDEMRQWQASGHLALLVTAVSRRTQPRYVQDALRAEAAELTRLIGAGARVMVCGGRDMAAGVRQALGDILAPSGLTPATLKAQGRYLEDVY